MLHFDATLVAALAFACFIGLLIYLKVPSMIAKALDDQSLAIASELEKAKELRVQAESLRASYEQQQKEAEAIAAELIEQAEKDAKALKAKAKKQLEADILAKTKAAEDRIARAEQAAIAEVKAFAAEQAVEAAQKMIIASTAGKGADAILKNSISKITSNLS